VAIIFSQNLRFFSISEFLSIFKHGDPVCRDYSADLHEILFEDGALYVHTADKRSGRVSLLFRVIFTKTVSSR